MMKKLYLRSISVFIILTTIASLCFIYLYFFTLPNIDLGKDTTFLAKAALFYLIFYIFASYCLYNDWCNQEFKEIKQSIKNYCRLNNLPIPTIADKDQIKRVVAKEKNLINQTNIYSTQKVSFIMCNTDFKTTHDEYLKFYLNVNSYSYIVFGDNSEHSFKSRYFEPLENKKHRFSVL